MKTASGATFNAGDPRRDFHKLARWSSAEFVCKPLVVNEVQVCLRRTIGIRDQDDKCVSVIANLQVVQVTQRFVVQFGDRLASTVNVRERR